MTAPTPRVLRASSQSLAPVDAETPVVDEVTLGVVVPEADA